MHELRSPAEKIQALFYQALKPVAGKDFSPLDVGVICKPLPEVLREALEHQRIDALMERNAEQADQYEKMANASSVTIDLSRTSFAEHVANVDFPLFKLMGISWEADQTHGTICFTGGTEFLAKVHPRALQEMIARSPKLDTGIAAKLSEAARGRAQAV